MRLARRAALVLPLLPLLAACESVTDPALPDGAARFAPPAVFATWWGMVEACADVSRPLAGVQWYVVPDADVIRTAEHGAVRAYWSAGSNQIVLAGRHARDGAVVRHEMLHALLGRAGHPRTEFLERCGGVVDCGARCILDAPAPPAPDPAAALVFASALEVSAALVPAPPTVARDSGHFAVVVTVRNPAPHPVLVQLRPDLLGAFPQSYALTVAGPVGVLQLVEVARDPGLASFAAGEVKRHVFDLVVGTRARPRHLPPGTYNVDAGFGGQWVRLERVTIGP